MKLIGSYTSPFVRKVKVILIEKKINFEFLEDIPWNEDTNIPKMNPLGKVPVLEIERGQCIFDSKYIAEVLELENPTISLVPKEKNLLLKTKQIEILGDGISDAGANIFIERKREMAKQDPSWIDRQKGKITLTLIYLSNELGKKNNFIENQFTLADISVLCALGYIDFRFPEIEWKQSLPNLNRFYNEMMQRESFANSKPFVK